MVDGRTWNKRGNVRENGKYWKSSCGEKKGGKISGLDESRLKLTHSEDTRESVARSGARGWPSVKIVGLTFALISFALTWFNIIDVYKRERLASQARSWINDATGRRVRGIGHRGLCLFVHIYSSRRLYKLPMYMHAKRFHPNLTCLN